MLGYGYWAVEEKVSGHYVGELGFADFKRDIQPSIEGMPELGWALVPRAHGKGYATEGRAENFRVGRDLEPKAGSSARRSPRFVPTKFRV